MIKNNNTTKATQHASIRALRSCYLNTLEYFKDHPYLSAVVIILLYLVFFQHSFITTGDAWAESYAEYLDESVRLGWSEVFAQNWAGYFSLIPSFLAKAYVYFNLPIGYIDWFYRGVTILFTILTTSLLALKLNRPIIKNDLLRILLSLSIVVTLFDITSFSFINIWYIGFLPIIFIYLNNQRISKKSDIAIGVFGALVSLTKPFLLILPVIAYRAIRSRQWIGPAILFAAAALQSYQILFNDRRQLIEGASFSLRQIGGGVFVGSGTSLLKLLNITPLSLWFVVGANLALVTLLVLIWRKKSFLTAATLGSIYIFAVYTYVLAPDLPAYHGLQSFLTMYNFDYKTQREIIINGTLMIMFFTLLDSYLISGGKSKKQKVEKYSKYSIFGAALILIAVIYSPIDTKSAGVSTVPIDSFRADLNNNLPSCVPLSPTPVFVADTNWVYAHKGVCATPNHDTNIFKPDFKDMHQAARDVIFTLDASYFRLNKSELMAVVIPVKNTSGKVNQLTITDQSGKKFVSEVTARSDIQFITFNTRGLSRQNTYNITINQRESGLLLGNFMGTKLPIVYTYFLKY